MSVLGVKPGEMGESLMLTRLEKDSSPITLHISTSRQEVSLIKNVLLFKQLSSKNVQKS